MKKNFGSWMRVLITMLVGFLSASAMAQNFAVNNFNFLYTNRSSPDPIYGYGTGNGNLQTYQFEHFSGNRFGDIYFDAELYHGHNVGAPFSNANFQNLLVFNPRLSFGKTLGKDLSVGPISDVSLIARWERGSYPDTDHFESQNYGLSVNFKVPGFAWFESGMLYRNTNFDKHTWLWRSVLLSDPIEVGGQKFHFNLLSLINGSNHNGTEVFERAELLWEIFGKPQYQLGARFEFMHYNNNPVGGGTYNKYMPEIMFKYTL
ncbi:hypothetical protein [Burkholderia cenocepacia]|uniref:hypothetical protein n=1 Tax=Burkholderia cenocepacia TaxID=95486 RepID=UPI002AB7B1B1|nr:hypothetical protein [Burkholderia cenocepacia]